MTNQLQNGAWQELSGPGYVLQLTQFSNKGPVVVVKNPSDQEIGRAQFKLDGQKWCFETEPASSALDAILQGGEESANALTKLTAIINSQEAMLELFEHTVSHPGLGDDVKPNLLQFANYLDRLRQGFDYAVRSFGTHCLPKNLKFAQDGGFGDSRYNVENDESWFSLLQLGAYSSAFGGERSLCPDPVIPASYGISPEHRTTLQAIKAIRQEAKHPIDMWDVCNRAIRTLRIDLQILP
ncbi:MAG: hypothetical protein SGJ27_27195 [Candidatus Melainabacteria bacterium]|nr:hypothetical protein [Candidatus Melainabacteria bacterium]